jgi:hypothetical protein
MIRFSLHCSQGHIFDDWFSSGTDYDAKAAAHEIACPECADTQVAKAIMAPNLNRSGKSAPAPQAACGVADCANGMCPMAAAARG